MTDVKRYSTNTVEVRAMELRQYGDFVRAAEWVNTTSSSYYIAYFQKTAEGDTVTLASPRGLIDARAGDVLVLGPTGEFLVMADAEFRALFTEIQNDPDEWQGSPVTHVPRGKEGASLLGGAALQVPR